MQSIVSRPVVFLGRLSLTVSNSSIGITPASIPSGTGGVIIGNGANPVNWLVGNDPTASVGIPLPASGMAVFEDIDRSDLEALRFIRQGASDSTVTFQWIAARSQRG